MLVSAPLSSRNIFSVEIFQASYPLVILRSLLIVRIRRVPEISRVGQVQKSGATTNCSVNAKLCSHYRQFEFYWTAKEVRLLFDSYKIKMQRKVFVFINSCILCVDLESGFAISLVRVKQVSFQKLRRKLLRDLDSYLRHSYTTPYRWKTRVCHHKSWVLS